MFDVFYLGTTAPALFVHERAADSVEHARVLSRTRYLWIVNCHSDYSAHDWLWEPPPWQSQQCHAWASQWQKDSATYLVPRLGYEHINYHPLPMIPRRPTNALWQIPNGIEAQQFDFSWHPDATEPAYIYQFGTQHQATGGPRYVMPGATEIKYVAMPRATKTTQDPHWIVPENMNTDAFDWTWHPDDRDPPFRYQFATQWNRAGGPEYVSPGARDIKFVTIQTARMLSTDRNWVIPDSMDLNSFDFSWTPDTTESAYIYQFGTQHQRTGGPRYVMPGATEVKYVNQIRIKTHRVATAIVEIDHLDGHVGKIPDTTRTVRYFDNYLDTLRRIAKNSAQHHEFIWICSSVCDYTDFDFSWHPEQWQATMLHVFASDGEKFGDTFFMHVPTFQYRADSCELLEWYDVNFIDTVSVPRRPMPVIEHSSDSHVGEIQTKTWAGPLAVFSTVPCDGRGLPAVPLWREKTKTVTPLDAGSNTVIVPKNAVPWIRTQVYDYAWIDRSRRSTLRCTPLDIVFISNGEPGAEHHHDVLQQCLARHQAANVVHRITDVQGRVVCYQAAARASGTDWFFAVFAKLQVNEDFDWRWQPDRLQQAKHYIFHAYNPVNHLTYGHQAMIAYNRRLVLENLGSGLDFTLDQAHEVVPVISGTAYYDNDPWTCWRTAFREALKLYHSLPDVENDYRLQQWLFVGDGVNGHWSTAGANDAVNYYESVKGDFDELKKSYEWSWLATYAMMVRPSLVIKT